MAFCGGVCEIFRRRRLLSSGESGGEGCPFFMRYYGVLCRGV